MINASNSIKALMLSSFFLCPFKGYTMAADLPFRLQTHSRISVRLSSPLVDGSTLLIGIPGGPGISGSYMDNSTLKLSKEFNANAAVIDLPNHGESGRASSSQTVFRYTEAKEMLISLLEELNSKGVKVILYGHSLGALIAADLMRNIQFDFVHVFLVSLPSALESSPEFLAYLGTHNALEESWNSEKSFNTWWKKALPAYFVSSIPSFEYSLLTSTTYWIGNEKFNEGLPDFPGVARDLVKQNKTSLITYFEGETEWVLPPKNFDIVRNHLPGVRAFKIDGTGHFPMIDKPEFISQRIRHHELACRNAF